MTQPPTLHERFRAFIEHESQLLTGAEYFIMALMRCFGVLLFLASAAMVILPIIEGMRLENPTTPFVCSILCGILSAVIRTRATLRALKIPPDPPTP